MAKVSNQEIPSSFLPCYIQSLQVATLYNPSLFYGNAIYGETKYGVAGIVYVRKRYPFELPHMKGL